MKVEILRGMSGSGKSTYAMEKQKTNPNTMIVSADHEMTDAQSGEYLFDPKRLTLVHVLCFKKFIKKLQTTANLDLLLVDNTNLCAWEVAPYAQTCLAFAVSFAVITFMPSNWHEVAIRNRHGVSVEKCWQQYQTLLSERLPPHWPHALKECS